MSTPTFDATDKLQLHQFAQNFEQFLQYEHELIQSGLVVSLDAPFGAGKTTFLQMWVNDLRARREQKLDLPVPIIINAWEDDYCGDPLTSMLAALAKSLDELEGKKNSDKKKDFTEGVKDVWWLLVGAGGTYVEHKLGFDPAKVAELAEKKKEGRGKTPDFITLYETRRTALNDIRTKLAECFGGSTPKAIVMIDELDRCRPDYAIHYLEVIKHIFNIPGLAFVLAVDKAQLESSTKALFGAGLDFPEYYRKFVHRNVTLPQPEQKSVYALCEQYVKWVFQPTEQSKYRPFSGIPYQQHFTKLASEILSGSNCTPRQIQEIFRMVNYVTRASKQGQELYQGYAVTTLFLSTLAVKNRSAYNKVTSQSLSPEDFIRLVQGSLVAEAHVSWWVGILLYGYISEKHTQTAGSALKKCGLVPVDATPEQEKNFFAGMGQVWGHFGVGSIKQVAIQIEHFSHFLQN